MSTYRVWYPSTTFCGETILADGYATKEEAKKHTNEVYPDIDWEDISEKGDFVVARSYGLFNPYVD